MQYTRRMGLFSSDNGTAARLAAIERKLDAIMNQLGINYPEGADDEVAALAKAGQVIEAIKLYRKKTGASLSDAKAFVDSLRS
mgnify:CR=1 FL=1